MEYWILKKFVLDIKMQDMILFHLNHLIGKYDYPIVDTSNYRDESFTTLIGAEVHTGAMSNGELWHMVAVGLPLDFSPQMFGILIL